MGGGWLDGGSFHMIEFNQCLLERRAGGESGVEWVEACKGDAAIAGEPGPPLANDLSRQAVFAFLTPSRYALQPSPAAPSMPAASTLRCSRPASAAASRLHRRGLATPRATRARRRS